MASEENIAVAHEHDDHAPHQENLWVIGGYLLVLTIATSATLILQQTNFWGHVTNILFVLMISVCKASLVVGFFMHFRYEKAWKFFLTIPCCTLALVLVMALLPDIAYGIWPKVPVAYP